MTTQTKRDLKVKEVLTAADKAAEVAETEAKKPLEMFFEHQQKALGEMVKAVESLLPKGTREHGSSAVKEVLEGYRGFVNSTIDEIVKLIERVKFVPEEEKKEKEVEKEKLPM